MNYIYELFNFAKNLLRFFNRKILWYFYVLKIIKIKYPYKISFLISEVDFFAFLKYL